MQNTLIALIGGAARGWTWNFICSGKGDKTRAKISDGYRRLKLI
jgi:hypothetical protein